MANHTAAKPRIARSTPPAPRPGAALPMDASSRRMARTVLSVLLVCLVLYVSSDFLTPLAWAAVIAMTTWPLYARFAGLFARRSTVLAPLLFTLAVGILLFVPVALAAHKFGQESERIVQWVTQLRESGVPVPGWLVQMPLAGDYVAQWWSTNLADPKGASALLGNINQDTAAQWTRAFGGQLLHRLLHFFIALVALFFLLRDGPWIAGRVLDTADRLLGDPGERLASKMVEAVRGTVMGTVVVAVVEGLLIGVAYVIAGVPNALLFTILTISFAMLPLGAWIAFTAASILLVLQGGTVFAAIAVFGFGATVMLIGDHFFWPTLVGNAARLPFLLALIGIFGGLQVFGLLGLFIGPVFMAALLTIWREWIVGPVAAND